jgi:SAM-dependent methyltransferase
MAVYTKEGIQKFYLGRQVAESYVGDRFVSELNRLLHYRQVAVVNKVIEVAQPKRILEIAPGPGRVTRDVRSRGRIICLEYNEGMIQHGRLSCNRDVVWIRGDGFQLPFGQAFDVVYTFRFLRHFHDEERKALYAAISRVLKPGGYFIMDAVNEKVSAPLREIHPGDYPVFDKLYQPDELRRELIAGGFEPLELLPVHKFFRCQHLSQVLLGPRANWANRLLIRSLERLPNTDGLEWVVTCRRG